MQTSLIPIAVTILTCYIVRSQSLSIDDLASLENRKYDRDANDGSETPTDDLASLENRKYDRDANEGAENPTDDLASLENRKYDRDANEGSETPTVRSQSLSIDDLANLENRKYDRDANDGSETPTDDLASLENRKYDRDANDGAETPTDDLASLENRKYDRDANDGSENPTDIRKLLLKKLRFRELLSDTPYTRDRLGNLDLEDSKETHKAKRRNMEDILTRVRALLSDMKERQVKETMSLPSLRFGRSGLSYHGPQ